MAIGLSRCLEFNSLHGARSVGMSRERLDGLLFLRPSGQRPNGVQTSIGSVTRGGSRETSVPSAERPRLHVVVHRDPVVGVVGAIYHELTGAI